MLQNPELPNGCEVTSLAMLLNWAGVETDKLELYQLLPRQGFTGGDGVIYGGDPEVVYAGDAFSETDGWYCFEGPVIEAGDAWLKDQGSSLTVQEVSGLGRDELEGYLSDGIPLAAWVTLEYDVPRYSSYTWLLPSGQELIPFSNLHCVVLTGLESGAYRVADPISGWTTVDREQFWLSFDAMGRRAVVVLDCE